MVINYVCPMPKDWNKICERLASAYHHKHNDVQKYEGLEYWRQIGLPIPLILAGWVYSSDFEKHYRWLETLEWAEKHQLSWVIETASFDKYGKWPE